MEHHGTTHWETLKYSNDSLEAIQEEIVTEYPLTLRLDGEEFATMVCTPSDLEDLVVGFLASEGIIRTMEEIDSLSIDPDKGFAYVELKNKMTSSKERVSKRFIGSCCGKSRQFYFQNDVRTAKTIRSRTRVTARQCIELMNQLQQGSHEFQKTGGLHNAALCEGSQLLVSRSDIGRHNALDKIYGHCIRSRVPTANKMIAFSGRISSEVLLKASKIGAGILLSKSAPSDLALKLADELGITAVGFIRDSKMNIYTHPERIAEYDAFSQPSVE
ncbi:formate dehydrogenase accessory sulfurtransferase FdhD [Paenibacillus turpanensis]|uniref:formate dehydrogenase accessory sulfurtransferase FdhD n=1 Tax=Paenibacillus turpanensis TaxID=2689078 RepID=UPI00140C7774|nr:formate dehydrogenase accessory sulfurtransferase FdhD [Paenibacillus turpanensis]